MSRIPVHIILASLWDMEMSLLQNKRFFSIGFGSHSYSIAVDDFNNDSFIDMVIISSGSNDIGIVVGYGNDSFTKQATYSTDSSSSSVAVGDFNNDFIVDIIIAFYDTNYIGVLLGYENGTFTNAVLIALGYNSHLFLVLVADFNNDSKLDFVVANSGSDSLQIFLQACLFVFSFFIKCIIQLSQKVIFLLITKAETINNVRRVTLII